MKGFEEIFPLIIAIFVAIALFLGVTIAIKKSLKPSPAYDTIDSTLQLKEQKRRMEDIQRRQKQFMQDQKQKIRDLQRL
jgi:phosphotransferase system  glucose/maltose/N-acetylglucosamine-specific IIC component